MLESGGDLEADRAQESVQAVANVLVESVEGAALFLRQCTISIAARLLADGGGVADVAEAVGYESEADFSRAFKKLVGNAPGMWRRQSSPLQGRRPL